MMQIPDVGALANSVPPWGLLAAPVTLAEWFRRKT